jgi:hypothetical protein
MLNALFAELQLISLRIKLMLDHYKIMSMEINKIWIDYKKTLKKSGKEETLDYF